VIARHQGIVLVDFAEAFLPVVELAMANAEPADEATSRNVGFVAPIADEVNDRVAGVVGDPSAL
jgi:hypothetical protein